MSAPRYNAIVLAALLASAAAAPADPPAAKAIHVIAIGDRRPLLLKLDLRVEGKPLDDVWNAYQKALFSYFDRDGDGFLTEAEARRAPSAEQVRRQFNGDLYTTLGGSSARFSDLDTARKGKIGLAEFSDYYRREGVGPLWIVPGGSPGNLAALSEALFKHLDTNHDGKVSREELAAATNLIRRLDADDDEYLTPDEILADERRGVSPPVKADTGGPTPRGSPGRLFFVLAPGDSPSRRTKLAHFATLPADGEYVIDLGKAGAGIQPIAAKAKVAGAGPHTIRGIILAGARLDLECTDSQANTAGIRSLYFQQFRTADRDRKGIVEKKQLESPALRLLQLLFPIADRNEDGRLTEKELSDYLDLHAQGAAAFVSMAVTARRALLFEILDADGDGRLGYRDLRSAKTRLAPYIREGEKGLTAEELPRQFAFVFARGTLAPNAKRASGKTESGIPAPDRSAPAWFRLMDRNNDGFVSPREFLGSPAMFRRLDTDGDELISVEEARKAGALPRVR